MDKGCQQIRSQGVDGKHMRETVFGLNTARFAVTNANVVYHDIEWAEPIDLFRDIPSLCDARHVTDCDRISARNSGQRLLCSHLVAGVQNNLMSLIDEKLGRHSAEPICRSRDKDTRHIHSPESCLETSKCTIDAIGKPLRRTNLDHWSCIGRRAAHRPPSRHAESVAGAGANPTITARAIQSAARSACYEALPLTRPAESLGK